MPNYRMLLQYDGTRYAGWQKQGNTENTLQGKLEVLLSRLCEESVEVASSENLLECRRTKKKYTAVPAGRCG